MPQDVLAEFKFAKVEGSTVAKAKLPECPSAALLLSVLVDKHGWKLVHTMGRKDTTQFVLQKAAAP